MKVMRIQKSFAQALGAGKTVQNVPSPEACECAGYFGRAVGQHHKICRHYTATDDEKFWRSFAWVHLQDGPDRNLDQIAEHRLPRQGCPACGAVWVSTTAVGFKAPRVFHAELHAPDHPARLLLLNTVSVAAPVEAFEIECFSGHLYRYHFTGRLTPAPPSHWVIPIMMGALGALAYHMTSAYALGAVAK